jgi:hypothetical protein
MQLFHKLVIYISIFVFIILFLYTAYVFYTTQNPIFPPDIPNCPDYWTTNSDGTCQIPHKGDPNLGNLAFKGHPIYRYGTKYSFLANYDAVDGNGNITGIQNGENTNKIGYFNSDIPYGYDEENPQIDTVRFNDPGWASYGDPYCEIQRWAKINNIQWDGMASYNKCT